MRVTFIDGIYPEVATKAYALVPTLKDQPWREQRDILLAAQFGCWDSWAQGCRGNGVEAEEIIVEAPHLDAAMEREKAWKEIAATSDAIVFRHLSNLPPSTIRDAREAGVRTVAMVSSAAPPDTLLSEFDLIVTPFPHYATAMAARGLNARYLALAFDPRRVGLPVDPRQDPSATLNAKLSRAWEDRDIPASFVGGLGIDRHWRASTHAVSAVAEQTKGFQWWGYRGPDRLTSALENCHQGETWGREYFAVLGRSRVTMNRHGEVHTSRRKDGSGRDWFACNMRLFEATGMGACLLTEQSVNLRDLFEPWAECVPFGNPREAAIQARYLQDHPELARRIAAAGQLRTLREHTYASRAATLCEWLEAL